MSQGRDLYAELALEHPFFGPGDHDVVERLLTAAESFRKDNLFFSAGLCMSRGLHAAWGDGDLVQRCLTSSLSDFKACVDHEPYDSYESLAALLEWRMQLRFVDRAYASHWNTLLAQESAQRLINYFSESQQRDFYLVRGFILSTDLDGHWKIEFPAYETRAGSSTMSGANLWLSMDSAFRLLIGVGDYVGAQAIAKRCPDAFTTHGLKGWSLAVEGFLNPGDAGTYFAKAAEIFAQDMQPPQEELLRRGDWSSANITLWAKYFAARSLVALIPRQPERTVQLLEEAADRLAGTEAGWVDPQVNRFRLLVNALLALLKGGALDVERVRRALRGDQWIFGEKPEDPLIEQFTEMAAQAFEAFRTNPAKELTGGRLHTALDLLGKMPLIGRDVAESIAPVMGEKALGEVLGPYRTWIYRTLENLKDEGQLQRIILRLEEAHLPRYAHLRHGPLEYGKDVVAVIDKDGRTVLRMWQAKKGDINMLNWRTARAELEEMYLVPLASLQISVTVDQRLGILVCNGHANTNVEPVMVGWFDEQKRIGREFEFMHIDRLVNWIVDERLISEFRAALMELNLKPCV